MYAIGWLWFLFIVVNADSNDETKTDNNDINNVINRLDDLETKFDRLQTMVNRTKEGFGQHFKSMSQSSKNIHLRLAKMEVQLNESNKFGIAAEGHIDQQLKTLRNDVTDIRKMLTEKVAFHARLQQFYVSPQSPLTVIFDQEITNVGNAYNRSSGEFKAPYDGIYVFACTYHSTGSTAPFGLKMMKNDEEISITHTSPTGYSEVGTMNAVVVLNQGSIVKVLSPQGNTWIRMIEKGTTFFTGYLL